LQSQWAGVLERAHGAKLVLHLSTHAPLLLNNCLCLRCTDVWDMIYHLLERVVCS
jgi:hypothetical protein